MHLGGFLLLVSVFQHGSSAAKSCKAHVRLEGNSNNAPQHADPSPHAWSTTNSSISTRIRFGQQQWAIASNADLPGMGDIDSLHASSLDECIGLCDTTSQCTAVSFVPGSQTCELKAIVIGRGINPQPSNTTTLAYFAAQTSCKALLKQGRRVKLLGQRDYTLDCDADAPHSDLKVVYVGSLNECMVACDTETGCTGVSYREDDQRCVLKRIESSAAVPAVGVDLAYLTVLADDFPAKDRTGVWGPTIDFPVIPVAAAPIPNSNRVIVWSADYADDYTRMDPTSTKTLFAFWDFITGEKSSETVWQTQHNMFCPGISFDAQGRLVVTGGSTDAAVSVFDGSWTKAPDMKIGRGYQSSVLTSDGRIFVIGGSWSGGNESKIGEVFDGELWKELSGCPTEPMETADKMGIYRSDNHAWLFAWKNGSVFQAGPSKAMNWYHTGESGGHSRAGLRGETDDSMCGNAVMYDVGKIVTMGGSSDYDNSTGHTSAYMIDLNDGARSKRVGNMIYPRTQANSVVLPNGEVLVVGGQAFSNLFTDYQAALYPEMFDPVTQQFRLLEAMGSPRTYHSVAVLLPDGTVFTGGGGLCGPCVWNHADANVFYPPYLFKGDGEAVRPVLSLVADDPVAGGRLTVRVGLSYSDAATFAIVRAGSSTHSTNTDQRRISLAYMSRSGTEYILQLPDDYGLMPPGWYMLFAMDDGVPSLSQWIQVKLR